VLTGDREVPGAGLLGTGQVKLGDQALQGKEIEAVIMVDNIILVAVGEQVQQVQTERARPTAAQEF
jgi:hypothetical protein